MTLRLEDLQPDCAVRGVRPGEIATVVGVKWHGSNALALVYRDSSGKVAEALLFRDDEDRLERVTEGHPWGFDGDGALYRLAAEAQRIRLAHLFDPMLAVHTSLVDPLPIRSRRSTKRCCRDSRCGFFSPTTPARARPSWRGFSSRN